MMWGRASELMNLAIRSWSFKSSVHTRNCPMSTLYKITSLLTRTLLNIWGQHLTKLTSKWVKLACTQHLVDPFFSFNHCISHVHVCGMGLLSISNHLSPQEEGRISIHHLCVPWPRMSPSQLLPSTAGLPYFPPHSVNAHFPLDHSMPTLMCVGNQQTTSYKYKSFLLSI